MVAIPPAPRAAGGREISNPEARQGLSRELTEARFQAGASVWFWLIAKI